MGEVKKKDINSQGEDMLNKDNIRINVKIKDHNDEVSYPEEEINDVDFDVNDDEEEIVHKEYIKHGPRIRRKSSSSDLKEKLTIKLVIPREKREVLKRDLLSKDDILSVKLVAPNSNAASVGIDDSLFSIEAFDASEEVKETRSDSLRLRKSLTNAKYFAVKSYPIDSIAKEKEDGDEYLRINGDIRIKRSGSSEPKELDRIFFTNYETAVEIAGIATEVEIQKLMAMENELNSVRSLLEDQLENGRF